MTDDYLVLSPSGIEVRVREIRTQNQRAETGQTGDRCALVISGPRLKKKDIHRGDWVLHESSHHPSSRIDARVKILLREPKALKGGTSVHVHIAAARSTGRLAIIGEKLIQPGSSGRVQLVMDKPMSVVFGDRLILRDQSARRTIGGGCIIDPFSPKRGRSRPDRLLALCALEEQNNVKVLKSLLEATTSGIRLTEFQAARNLTDSEAEELWPQVQMIRFSEKTSEIGFSKVRWRSLRNQIRQSLKRWHEENPQSQGPDQQALRKILPKKIDAGVFYPVIRDLLDEGVIRRAGTRLHIPSHKAALSRGEIAIWNKLASHFEQWKYRPPVIREIAKILEMKISKLSTFFDRAAQAGLVVQIESNRYLQTKAVVELALIAEGLAAESPNKRFTAAEYRDRSGVSRNLAIELLEHFDRSGLTRREGKGRLVLRPSSDVFGDSC